MSFIDLATLAMHRRQELDARLNGFLGKCDQTILYIKRLKMQAQSFTGNLNCEPAELKDRFLSCMNQLDEYNYLVTDFNIALERLDLTNNIDYPVHDVSSQPLQPVPLMTTFNLMDALSEPSTSQSCSNQYKSEKPLKKRITQEDQLLITFSSASCSSESVPVARSEKEVQCQIIEQVQKLTLEDYHSPLENCNLPAQEMLQVDQTYPAMIMHVDGLTFWVITQDINEVYEFMVNMTDYYRNTTVEMSLDELMSLTYCAYYDEECNCFYRGFFIRLTDEAMTVVELYSLDTGETRFVSTAKIQPLDPRFCNVPPFARCCHLAGVDLLNNQNKVVMEKQELFLKNFTGTLCDIKIDDNSSESLGVYVILNNGKIVNDLIVKEGLAIRNDRLNTSAEAGAAPRGLPELDVNNFDIMLCPEYEDPVEAVTGYRNRDEIDICKHYKGSPDKMCFKGTRCTKRHVLKHPDGWTLDRTPVVAKCTPAPLPKPDTWHRVYVTHVAHFDHFYVHFLTDKRTNKDTLPSFGVVLPPTTLEELVVDMNCPASRMTYKPLQMIPAPGELVAALYPLDEQWYRARVISSTRADQNVEVMYIDYGNVVWLKEDAVRTLDARHCALPAQAALCALAGAAPLSADSKQWVCAREALAALVHERTLHAHVVARDYDEVTVELFDDAGNSVGEQLAAARHIKLRDYDVCGDDIQQKIVVP